jgi:hypothetical protein
MGGASPGRRRSIRRGHIFSPSGPLGGPILPARVPKWVGQNRVSVPLTPLCSMLQASGRKYAAVVYYPR